ncbi:hypothetical protein [Mycolicibacterium fortuitum]|uniref:Uncharacterized protein n=2 Tax=Mycolicibacterium fortuitum TaxID=1766 RepID=A0AAE4VF92_MYCFO|nr:hypothetical protein [Mycolicibacterium fortuitum]MCV7142889.1 hypothetical protein [Mycolicibacterium fortuitum]MDV7190594.1 hypothetical protein [Mycolicibacterium fortuitum]MDV7207927.1 hypothetical protein [Mycolicibacterium fortuitum]MDV7229858.1 hypothetical protein [Mycolicibacterium fortuitum]MDV7257785.1 hypothetical protein [Mycolicibacterium fortuitum]
MAIGNGLYAEPGDTQSMYPERDNYVAPPPPDEYRIDPQPVRVRAARTEGTVLEQAHAAIVHAYNEFGKHLKAVDANKHRYSADGYREQVDAFNNTDAVKAIDQHVDRVRARRDEAQKEVNDAFRALSPNGDAAAESRATRYWNRAERLLDSTKGDKLGVARELVAKASREELGTLLQELPTYLQSVGSPSSWIDADVATTVPEYSAAKAKLQRAEQSLQLITADANRIKQGFVARRMGVPPTNPSKYDPDR